MISKSFGKDEGFTLGLTVLGFISGPFFVLAMKLITIRMEKINNVKLSKSILISIITKKLVHDSQLAKSCGIQIFSRHQLQQTKIKNP